ncbi:hypothetical protein TNCV_1000891 [Trichonephila clavipes]|nr:hypothetical protein TNCV_1000891 [Trichonephila clavipes]
MASRVAIVLPGEIQACSMRLRSGDLTGQSVEKTLFGIDLFSSEGSFSEIHRLDNFCADNLNALVDYI